MKMDINTVRKLAFSLERIAMTDEELKIMGAKLDGIMVMVEQLQAVDTNGVEPLANVVDIQLKLRADVVNDGGDPKKVISNAPEAVEDFYVVPKVVE